MKNIIFIIAAFLLFLPGASGQFVSGQPGPAKVVKGVTILLDELRSDNYIEYWTPPGQTSPILPDYAPNEVCKEYAQPGARFMNGSCAQNYAEHIPLNSPASYRCEKVFGAGKCTSTDFYKDEPVRYIPSCPAGFQYVGGYRILAGNDGGYFESTPITLASNVISPAEDAAFFSLRGQILCGRLKPKRVMVSSYDGSYVAVPNPNQREQPKGDWVPTNVTFQVEGDKVSGTFVSPAGTNSIDDGKIVGKDITFTVTVEGVVYSYEGFLMPSYYGAIVTATWTVDHVLHLADFMIKRPEDWRPFK